MFDLAAHGFGVEPAVAIEKGVQNRVDPMERVLTQGILPFRNV
jgi:hypothetical protein